MLHPRGLRGKHINFAFVSVCLLIGLWWFTNDVGAPVSLAAHSGHTRHKAKVHHPLDDVIHKAQKAHDARLSERTTGLSAAASAYRSRRGRHPPPGFDRWHARAVRSRAIIVESFFDQIYEDLEPFWGLASAEIRGSLAGWRWTIRIRNGKVEDVPQGRFRSRVWGDMFQRVAADLPDMDVAINPLDEPRVFAPWSKIDSLVESASLQRSRMMSRHTDEISGWQDKPDLFNSMELVNTTWIKKGSLWPHIVEACDSSRLETKFDRDTFQYTTNWTTMKDVCANHHWADLHGSLTHPATMDIANDLVPLFSAAKLQGSNDILLPPPSYYTDDALFTGNSWFGDGKTSVPWSKKLHGLVWRGKATGGQLQNSSWSHSHRQRLVSMLNAPNVPSNSNNDAVKWLESGKTQIHTSSMEKWLRSIADVGFTDMLCSSKNTGDACKTMTDHFSTVAPLAMRKQYRWKYLPDIDGNSLSGRFRAFLGSNSSPMKATIFKEWHDSRLMPWVHFIPLDITLRDLWHIMAYFLGFEEMQVQAHDVEGKRIATEGQLWAESVLRKEDMELYVHRVLLEYARLRDDDRDSLGFVADLQAGY